MALEEEKLENIMRVAQERADANVAVTRVEALDPDFILILFFAIGSDAVFFVLAFFDATIVTWVIGFVLSVPCTLVVGLWDYYRTGRTDKVKEEADKRLKEVKNVIQKRMDERVAKKAVAEGSKRTTLRSGQTVAKRTAGKTGVRTGTKAATTTGRKIVLKRGYKIAGKMMVKRGGVATIGTNIPYVGMIPFYTIWVVLKLREK